MIPRQSTSPPDPIPPTEAINTATDFARFFTHSGKPAGQWAIGAEVELFGFTRDGLERITPEQVQTVIRGFAAQTISRLVENDYVTEAVLRDGGAERKGGAEARGRGDAEAERSEAKPAHTRTFLLPFSPPPRPELHAGRITLEPGGQIEFSAAPHRALINIERSLARFTRTLKEVGDAHGMMFIAAGFDPLRELAEQKWIPKPRYDIMRPYLNTRGQRAWDMMCRTAAIQVNLDYDDLEDLAKKFALANRLAPVAAAIFANSPFEHGKLSGYKSTRYRAWLDTDPDRTGPSPVALEEGFTIDRYMEYVSRVPMLFVRRDGQYLDYAGHSFSEYLAGCGCPTTPIFQDFTDHLTTIFTEARLKPHIEQRSMDCGSLDMAMAALAFWKGLMYDRRALADALLIAPKLTRAEYAQLQLDVSRRALDAQIDGASVSAMADAAIAIARDGLARVARDEAHYLDILDERVTRERLTAADILIRNFNGTWHGDIRKVMDYLHI